MLGFQILQLDHRDALIGDVFADVFGSGVVVESTDVSIDGEISAFDRYQPVLDASPDDCLWARSRSIADCDVESDAAFFVREDADGAMTDALSLT